MSVAAARDARIELERLLETHGPALLATLPAAALDAIERYVALLLEANARLNLTRIVEPAAVARLHLLDALVALPLIDEAAPRRAIDVGSGGGVPGLVLAIVRPDVEWSLVDSVRKKADALAAFTDALHLENARVLAERSEILGRDPAHRDSYDLVTARACAPLPVLAEYAIPLLRTGGLLVAWKGAIEPDELRGGRAAALALGGDEPVIRAAGLEPLGDHRFVTVRKAQPSPDQYPRRPGTPSRRPLG